MKVKTRWASQILSVTAALLLSSCAQNSPFRTGGIANECYENLTPCRTAIIEQHLEFDVAFIEFTQRGNLFDRSKSETVINYIDALANSDNGVAVFVFAHGWKHNAASNDSNVEDFREMLSRAAENPFVGRRRVVGVYLGWRGKVTSLPVVKELSYWGRKSVAEEVGSGGATEVLTELQQVLVRQFEDSPGNGAIYKNTYVIIGHSFGGAIVLSALHDVLLTDLIAASRTRKAKGTEYCAKVDRFADGIILINPAIEANRAILLREAAAKCEFRQDQAGLMHVLSSEADLATNRYFPLGQYVNVTTTLSPKKLARNINGKTVVLSEQAMDVTTVGNFDPLRTGYLFHDGEANRWSFNSCRDGLAECGLQKPGDQTNHVPVTEHDPLRFIRTDANFIRDHNDAFSCYVQSYITTVMFQTQSIDRGYVNLQDAGTPDQEFGNCDHREFDFGRCFNNQLYDYNCELSR